MYIFSLIFTKKIIERLKKEKFEWFSTNVKKMIWYRQRNADTRFHLYFHGQFDFFMCVAYVTFRKLHFLFFSIFSKGNKNEHIFKEFLIFFFFLIFSGFPTLLKFGHLNSRHPIYVYTECILNNALRFLKTMVHTEKCFKQKLFEKIIRRET